MTVIEKLYLKTALHHMKKGEVEKTLSILNRIKCNCYEKHYYAGTCYFDIGENSRAEEELDKALIINKNFECAFVLAQILIMQGKWLMAKEILKPYKKKKETEEIIRIINSGRDDKGKYIRYITAIRKGINLIKNKRYEDSIRCFEESLDFTENKSHVYNQIGAVYNNYIKNKEMAEKYFRLACKLSPGVSTYKKNLARVKFD